jgi:signal transduction histidine kinase
MPVATNPSPSDLSPTVPALEANIVEALLMAISAFPSLAFVVRLEVFSTVDCVMPGEQAAWSKAFYDLLRSALKVTPPGAQVHVGLHADEENLRFSVIDAGDGYDVASIRSLGDGRALADVRALVERAGGQLLIGRGGQRPGTYIEMSFDAKQAHRAAMQGYRH